MLIVLPLVASSQCVRATGAQGATPTFMTNDLLQAMKANEIGLDVVGHAIVALLEALRQVSREIPVVLASRTATGQALHGTCRYLRGEVDLLEAGLISSNSPGAIKSWVLLALYPLSGADCGTLSRSFERIGTFFGAAERG